ELLVVLDDDADARGAEEADPRTVERYPVIALADGVGERPIEVIGPVAVDPSVDLQLEHVADRSRDLHRSRPYPPITLFALVRIAAGVVNPRARVASWFTISVVAPRLTNGMAAGDSPRMMRAAIRAASRPLS